MLGWLNSLHGAAGQAGQAADRRDGRRSYSIKVVRRLWYLYTLAVRSGAIKHTLQYVIDSRHASARTP